MSACNCYYPLILYLADENLVAKILSYNRANRAVAILCNHQRAPPKTFEKSMQNLQTKVSTIANRAACQGSRGV